MGFYLDTLLHLPDMTVDGCHEAEGTIFLQLKCLNESVPCPHCGASSEHVNQSEIILIRDLPIFGKPVYLQVPRRQFHCLSCGKFATERLAFISWRHHQTQRYEQAIYEQVKQSSLAAVSRQEGLGIATVRAIFEAQAQQSLKK